ncbi:MAG: ComF family protein [Cyclobacteriaceae bacterium]
MPKTNYHLESPNPIESRFYGKVPLDFALAYLKFYKRGLVQQLLHHLKYKQRKEIGKILGNWYGEELKKVAIDQQVDLIVPVPLHKRKQKARGYNQSSIFAAGLSEHLGIEHQDNVLLRPVMNASQTKKSRMDRWQNVKDAFTLPQPAQVAGKRIMLVDDVVTTGSTLEACANLLLEAGAASVGVVCIAAAR